VANERRLFRFGAHPCCPACRKHEDRNVVAVAKLHEARGLVRAVAIDGAAQMLGIVGDDADRAAFDAREAVIMPGPELSAEFQPRAVIGERLDHASDVVDAQTVFWNGAAKQALVRAGPIGSRALEIGGDIAWRRARPPLRRQRRCR